MLGVVVLEIDINDLQIGEELGTGRFGVVTRGVWKSRHADVAVKTLLTKLKLVEEVRPV